jgi:hypothetical protein
VAAGDLADWARRLGSVAPAMIEPTPWPNGTPMVATTDMVFAAPPGSHLAQALCLCCRTPAAGRLFKVWTMISCCPCDLSDSHLPAVSAIVHVECAGLGTDTMAQLLIQSSEDCFTP